MLPLGQYFFELRNRFLLLFLNGFFLCFVCCCLYKEVLFYVIIEKPFFTNIQSFYFIVTNVLEIFYVQYKISLCLCYQIFIYYVIYHFFCFFSSSFFFMEYLYVKSFFKNIVFLMFVFSYVSVYVVTPVVVSFVMQLQIESFYGLHFEVSLKEYVNLIIKCYWFFLSSLLLLWVLNSFFTYKSVLNKNFLKKRRKMNYYFFFVFSTCISPPDVLSQLIVSFFLIFFFEGIVFVRFFLIASKL